MFYQPDLDDHGLPFNPFKSVIVPRPIGWITTVDLEGRVNLAPYSQFQNVGFDPPYILFSASSDRHKHTAANCMDTGEFVTNMATYDLREAINITSQTVEAGVSEAELAGLELVPSKLVKPPRVAASPVHLECKYYCSMALPGRTPGALDTVVVGRVVGVHIHDDFITPDGRIDILKIRPLARMGYMDYTSVTDMFEMKPDGLGGERLSKGLQGLPRKRW
jgi:flavin reductase (DIM6/NTAB) family NADH-FMN oxidoreductase RutF